MVIEIRILINLSEGFMGREDEEIFGSVESVLYLIWLVLTWVYTYVKFH